ncbi:MAG: amidohydrolase family protein [Bdellovibrionales bacterium]|nr:amidohydrolase family protein [Bdellovibrionales bacterium]
MDRMRFLLICAVLPLSLIACSQKVTEPERAPATFKAPATIAEPAADVHFHTKNFVQEGIRLSEVIPILDSAKVKRAAVFGIPLQQNWDMSTGVKPGYYLHDDQELYYYSAVDAFLALEFQELSEAQKPRLDPMIVGFNPTDGRATDHIRNMLLRFPGVFSGIGEFSIEKEVVSSKVAGRNANINDPALDNILRFAAETGLVVLLHCDVDAIISGNENQPTYFQELSELFARHPETTIVWAHSGLGRFVKARPEHTKLVAQLLKKSRNLFIDISWDVVLNQLLDGEGVLLPEWKEFLMENSQRVLFGTDVVAPKSADYAQLVGRYHGLFQQLPEAAAENIRIGNYQSIFDSARRKIRAWEMANS